MTAHHASVSATNGASVFSLVKECRAQTFLDRGTHSGQVREGVQDQDEEIALPHDPALLR
ncbi:hypothetical protein SALBM311S_09967 [Streptomyces alboniger]